MVRQWLACAVAVCLVGTVLAPQAARGQAAGAPVQRGAEQGLGKEATSVSERITQAVTLSESQKAKLNAAMVRYDKEVAAYRDQVRKRPMPMGNVAAELLRRQDENAKAYLEMQDRAYEQVETEVLTAEQVPAVQIHRLGFAVNVALSTGQLTPEQQDRIRARAAEIHKSEPATGTHLEQYVQQKQKLQQWARENVLTPEQLKKVMELELRQQSMRQRAGLAN